MAWTIGVFYSLKVVKRKMIKDFGPATRDHINSLARRFETEAGYIVDYGVDGSFAYARFQKIDRSDFEHVASTESHRWIGLACLIAMFRYLVVVMLCAVLLFCPLGILLLSELGTSGLQQRIESSPMHQDLNYPQVRFSQWSYFNPQYPQATRIIFSPEQRTSLGMSESDSMVLKMVPARIAALAYTWFLFCGLNLYLRSGTTLHQQQKSTWFIGAAALSSCLLAVLALFPIMELFEKSPICGPHYVELPFERRYASDDDDHYRYYGTTSILRDDIDAGCELGKDAYWQSGLGAANLIFLFLWFCRQRFYIRKQNLLALTEANLKYYCHDDLEDCDLDEIQTVKQANHSREELERSKTFIFTDTSSDDDDSTVEGDDPSRKQIVWCVRTSWCMLSKGVPTCINICCIIETLYIFIMASIL